MYITCEQLKSLMLKEDLSQSDEHCIGLLVKELKLSLENYYQIQATLERGTRVVSIDDNYYNLNYKNNEVTLGVRYSKYIDDKSMLRTQMSSTIPSLLRNYKKDGDKLYICPGIVYRRDVRDKSHVGEPHQMDIWYLSEIKKNREDLLNLVRVIISVVERISGTIVEWRYSETTHNYTDEGIEVEIKHNGQWLEILECGLIGQNILDNHNLSHYSGLALGLGLDRLVMILKQIDDIRILYDSREKIQEQMRNLKRYKEISKQPSIQRDMSIAIPLDMNEEELTEIVSTNLHPDILNIVESIKLVEETSYNDLPIIAIQRLGINDSQKNVLLRVVLRDLIVSIPRAKANEIYNEIYKIVHCGKGGYLINS